MSWIVCSPAVSFGLGAKNAAGNALWLFLSFVNPLSAPTTCPSMRTSTLIRPCAFVSRMAEPETISRLLPPEVVNCGRTLMIPP
jgi:hypothetical protein